MQITQTPMIPLPPYDLGKNLMIEQCEKINIDSILSTVSCTLKDILLKNTLEANGLTLELTKTKTGFGGERYWWKCPCCNRACKHIFNHPLNQIIACRRCLKLKYKSSNKKGMIENQI